MRRRRGRDFRCFPLLLLAAALSGCDADIPPPPEPAARGAPPVAAPSPGPVGAGVIAGRVVYRGPLPETTTMSIPEAGELEAHTIIVDPETRGLRNAVVWVEGAPRGAKPVEGEPATLDQRNWTFTPHVVALRAGQQLRMVNSDIANHNIHSSTPGHEFNLGTPIGNMTSRRFHRPTGPRPIRLDCNIHEWMRAWVYVFDHPHHAITARDGAFRIEGVPVGTWQLLVHHADGNLAGRVEGEVRADAVTEIEIPVESMAR